MLTQKPRSSFFKTFRPSLVLPIFMVIIVLFIWSFARRARLINQQFSQKKTRSHGIIRPDLFYPFDDIILPKELNARAGDIKNHLQSLENEADKGLANLPDRPSVLILPAGNWPTHGPTWMSGLTRTAKFRYTAIYMLTPVTAGTFSGMSMFSGQGFRTNTGEIKTSQDLVRQEILKNKNLAYHPTFFFKESRFNSILPLLIHLNMGPDIGFLLIGHFPDNPGFQEFILERAKMNILLVFLFDEKIPNDLTVMARVRETLKEKASFHTVNHVSDQKFGFFVLNKWN